MDFSASSTEAPTAGTIRKVSSQIISQGLSVLIYETTAGDDIEPETYLDCHYIDAEEDLFRFRARRDRPHRVRTGNTNFLEI